MRIEVTKSDIADGARGNCELCPVALALRRATGQRWAVSLHSAWRVARGGWRRGIELSLDVVVWVQAFDRGEPVAPFAFEVPDA